MLTRNILATQAFTLLATLPFAVPAVASSDDAWEAFRTEVATACEALVPGLEGVTVEVNPFGSTSYGIALITVKMEAGTDRMVCIFDKATKVAELTGPFTPAAEDTPPDTAETPMVKPKPKP